MSRRRVWLRRIGLAALLTLVCQQIWRHGQDYVFADKFYAIEPGKVYRGAWQQNWPMKRIIANEHIKTIVALAHTPDNPLSVREKALCAEKGVRWVHIPIVEDRTTKLADNISDQLEKAAGIIADPANQPVYFHCHHGINRASMVHIAYRTMYCGWDLDRATKEVADQFGLVEVDHGPDYRHMAKFYNERVLPRRAAQVAAKAKDTATR
jgi:protein tyrosine/serine phosphatase